MTSNIIKTILIPFCLVVTTAGVGCEQSSDDYSDIEDRNAEIVSNLLEAGFSESNIEIRESIGFNSEFNELEAPSMQVFVDGDIQMTLDASRELLDESEDEDELTFRHWRSPSLVYKNKTICLAKVTNASGGYSSFALTNAMKTGVNRAKENFNALNSFSLHFKLGNASLNSNGQLSHNITNCNYSIFIYKVSGAAGGSAGFPSNGAPYGQIKLRSGLASYSLDTHEHVATHEIGHAIGLRHTDWKTRSSCGEYDNEPQNGASQISGTANQTTNSVMSACFNGGTNGEFRGEDAEALGKIY